MDYAFEGNRAIVGTQLEPGFEGAQITCDVRARPTYSCTQK